MRNRLGRIAALASTAALLAAGTAHAVNMPDFAVAPDGTAHAVWSHNDNGFTLGQWNVRTADGLVGEGDFFTPSGKNTASHRVAADAAGRAVAVWLSPEAGAQVVRLRARAADGGLGPVQTISTGDVVGAPQLAIEPDGDAVIAWSRFTDQRTVVEIRRRAANGTLSSIERLSSSAPTYNTQDPALALDPQGNAYVAWTVLAPTALIQIRRRAADGTLSATQNVTTVSAAAGGPRIAVDAGGNAVIAWRRAYDGLLRLQTRRRSASGTFGAIVNVSPAGSGVDNPDVAVSPGGSALFAWQRTIGANGTHIETRRRAPGGSLGAIETASVEDETSHHPRVAVDGDGDFVVAWRRTTGAGASPQARRRSAAGAWSTIADLGPAGTAAEHLDLAVEPGGAATFGWLDTNSPLSVKVRRQTAAGELSSVDTLSY